MNDFGELERSLSTCVARAFGAELLLRIGSSDGSMEEIARVVAISRSAARILGFDGPEKVQAKTFAELPDPVTFRPLLDAVSRARLGVETDEFTWADRNGAPALRVRPHVVASGLVLVSMRELAGASLDLASLQ